MIHVQILVDGKTQDVSLQESCVGKLSPRHGIVHEPPPGVALHTSRSEPSNNFITSSNDHGEEEWTGLKIMKEQENRHNSETELTTETMILTDKNGKTESRIFRKYIKKEFKKDITGLLVVFDAPKSIAGTALLTWDNKKRENDQWLYLPAQGDLRRIASGSKKGYFMGTDFTFEDMEPENINDFHYKILGTETISKLECWKIEATPANEGIAKISGYSRRILYIIKKLFITVKIEFYDKRNTHVKTLLISKLKKINGTRYRPKISIMKNLKTGHSTKMEVTAREIDSEMKSDYFQQRYITTKRHMKE
jgi:hypothetical protein